MNIHKGKSFKIMEFSGKVFEITIIDIDISCSYTRMNDDAFNCNRLNAMIFVSYRQTDDKYMITDNKPLESFCKWIERGRERYTTEYLGKAI